MKLTYTALALTLIMLGLSIFLVFQGNQTSSDIRELEDDLAETRGVVAETRETVAATQQQAAMAAGSTQDLAQRVGRIEGSLGQIQNEAATIAGERDALAAEAAVMQEQVTAMEERASNAEEAAASAPKITPLQRKVMSAPALGTLAAVEADAGFVILDSGGTEGIQAGAAFAVRRGVNIVGNVTVSALEGGSIIANIEQGSVPEGISLMAGDEVIMQPAP